jgi:hypothetical protein
MGDAICKGRGDLRMGVENLANLGQMRKQLSEFVVEVMPERSVDEREGIDVQSVGPSLLDPPNGVLAKVLRDDWIICSYPGGHWRTSHEAC